MHPMRIQTVTGVRSNGRHYIRTQISSP